MEFHLPFGHAEGKLLGIVGGAVGFLGDGIEVDAHVGCGIDVEMQIGHVRHVERLIVAAILAEPVERGVTIRLIASSERLQNGPRLLIPGSKRPVGVTVVYASLKTTLHLLRLWELAPLG